MKRVLLLFLLLISVICHAQNSGISYQAVILNPDGEQLPGFNNPDAPLANEQVCLRFSLFDASMDKEYEETIFTTTDKYGMVNVVIGTGIRVAGNAPSFDKILWENNMTLAVALDTNGACSNFEEISRQLLSSVPFAYAAENAFNVTGIVAIENGGTNAATVADAKINLGLDKVDNTADLDKPVSTSTQMLLNTKEETSNKSSAVALGDSDILYPTQKAVKAYVDANIAAATTSVADEIERATNAEEALNASLAQESDERTAADAASAAALASESQSRADADSGLAEDIATETTRAINAESSLSANLLAEAATRSSADEMLNSAVAAETANRTSSDTALTNSINTEVTRATTAENTIAANLTAEINNRATADTGLSSGLNNEITNRTNAVNTLSNSINGEIARATNAENTIAANLASEANSRTTADTAMNLGLTNETGSRINADNALSSSISAEVTRASVAENTIAANLSTETNNRTAADAAINLALSGEVQSRTNADNILTGSLSNEVTRATAAESTKESLANKSLNIASDAASDIKYPSVKAVKAYVDAQTVSGIADGAIQTVKYADESITDAKIAYGINPAKVGLGNVDDTSDANKPVSNPTQTQLDLKENLTNKSLNINTDATSNNKYPSVKAVKDYVDATSSSSASLTGDVTKTGNTVTVSKINGKAIVLGGSFITAGSSALTLTTTGTTNLTLPTTGTLATTGNITTAVATKEDSANKSTDVIADSASNTKYPSVKAVKDYVDSATANANLTGDVTSNGSNYTTVGKIGGKPIVLGGSFTTSGSSALNLATTGATNLTLPTSGILATTDDISSAISPKENTSNKSTDVNADSASQTKYPSVKAIKDYVDVVNATNAPLTGDVTSSNNATIVGKINGRPISLGGNFTTTGANPLILKTTGSTDITLPVSGTLATTTDLTAATLPKEDVSNKSTSIMADGGSNLKYPGVKAVKDYVDAQTAVANIADGSVTAAKLANDAVITQKIADGSVTNVKIASGIDPAKVGLGNVDNTSDSQKPVSVAAWTELDKKEALANKSTNVNTDATSDIKYPSVKAIKDYVDNVNATNAPLTGDVTSINNATTVGKINGKAIILGGNFTTTGANPITLKTTGNTDVTLPVSGTLATTTDLAATILPKEDSSNKSTSIIADASSNQKYPSVKAIKDYVDNTNATNAPLTGDVTSNGNNTTVGKINGKGISLGGDFSTAGAFSTNLIATANTTLTLPANGILATTNDLNTAVLPKEDVSNKSTDVTIDASSNTKYPSVKAIKDYIDNVNATNAPLTGDVSSINNTTIVEKINGKAISLGGNFTTVGAHTTTIAVTADTNIQLPVSGVLATTNDITNAVSGKEDSVNKSTDVSTDAASDLKYPSVKAIKSYVDDQINAIAVADLGITTQKLADNAVTTIKILDGSVTNDKIAGNIDPAKVGLGNVTIPASGTLATTSDIIASTNTKESLSNKSTNVANDGGSDTKYPSVKAVKDYVDSANANIALTGDVISNNNATTVGKIGGKTVSLAGSFTTSGANALTLTTTGNTNVTLPVSGTLATEESVNPLLILKEDSANKSTDVTTDSGSDSKYPSVKAVKTYVDGQISAAGVADLGITTAKLANGAVTTIKIADANVTDAKIAYGIDKAKVGLDNVDNTSDTDKPVSIATITALNLKEDSANKSINIASDGNSDAKYPSVKAIKTYVDEQIAAVEVTDLGITTAKLADDAVKTVKVADGNITDAKIAFGIDKAKVGLSNVDNTSDANKPVSTATANALNLKENLANKSISVITDANSDTKYPSVKAIKDYVDNANATNANLTGEVTSVGNATTITNAAVTGKLLAGYSSTTGTISAADSILSAIGKLNGNMEFLVGGGAIANLTYTSDSTKATISGGGTNDAVIPLVTSSSGTNLAGLMAPADKAKLDAMSANYPLTLTTSGTTSVTLPTSGTLTTAEIVNPALALKEDSANKSTNVTTDANSDMKYPSVKAVKTYVDSAVGNVALTGDVTSTNNATTVGKIGGKAVALAGSFTTAGGNALTLNTTGVTSVTLPLSGSLATENYVDTAVGAKESTANKSTNVATDGNSDSKYPSVKAVKSYVDAQTAVANIADGAITNSKLATDAVTTIKILDGNITDAKIAFGIDKSKVGLGNVDNTSDANKPVSSATTTALNLKENSANKSISVTTDATSDIKYPSVKAIKDYVDNVNATNANLTGEVTSIGNNTTITNAAVTGKLLTGYSSTTGAISSSDSILSAIGKLNGNMALILGDGTITNLSYTSDSSKAIISGGGSNDAVIPVVTSSTGTNLAGLMAPADKAKLDAISANYPLTLTTTGATSVTLPTSGTLTTAEVVNPALALKEDLANKSANVATDGGSDTKYPSVKAVKTYVDAANANVVLTGDVTSTNNATTVGKIGGKAVALGGSFTTVGPYTTTLTATANTSLTLPTSGTLANQNYVDTVVTSKEDAANKSTNVSTDGGSDTKYPSVKAVKTYVDGQISAAGVADLGITTAKLANDAVTTIKILDGNVTDAKIASGIDKAKVGLGNVDNTSDANKPVSTATTTALNLKENLANKSINVTTDATSDTKYPSVKAIKDYVDAADASPNLTGDVTSTGKATTVGKIGGKTIALAGNLTTTGANALTLNTTGVTSVTLPLSGSLATENYVDTAVGVKESTANKSTNVTTDGNSDTKYPSVKAVKTYVDAQTAVANIADGAITNSKLAIDAVTTIKILDGNVTDAKIASGIDKAKVGLGNVDNTSDANKPVSTATSTALNLKENLANKSINVTSDATSDTKYPSVKAIKDYVDAADASPNLTGDVTSTGKATTVGKIGGKAVTLAASFTTTGANALTLNTTGVTSVTLPLSGSLATENYVDIAVGAKESTANKSTNVITDGNSDTKYPSVKAVKTYVDAQTAVANIADGAITNSKLATDAVTTIKILDGNVTDAKIASGIDKAKVGLGNVDNTSDANKPVSTATATALNLKENLANKSINVTTDATSDTKYPSVKAIKDYVDTVDANPNLTGDVTSTGKATTVGKIGGKSVALAGNLTTTGANTLTLNTTGATTVTLPTGGTLATEGYVTTTIGSKEDSANKSTNVTTDAASDTKFPSVKAIKDYVDTADANPNLTGDVTSTGKATTVGKIGGKAVALGGSLTTSGTSALTLTTTGATNVTLPTTGTLATIDGTETLTNKTLTGNSTSTIAGFNAAVNTVAGTTYTLTQSDNGKVLNFTNAAAITLTIPAGLSAGFNCLVVQYGAGAVTFSASGTTIVNKSNYTKTAGTYSIATVVSPVSNVFITSGNMN